MRDTRIVRELGDKLTQYFASYSNPKYDLWQGGVAKGNTPKVGMWLERNPWPWIKNCLMILCLTMRLKKFVPSS